MSATIWLSRLIIVNRFSSGSIETLKWIALVLMTGDHINKYLFNATLPWLFEAGRLALPIFVFVLAYNLSRENSLERGAYKRVCVKLGAFGMIASVPFIMLGGMSSGWLPLNVMFTLMITTLTIYFIDRGELKNYCIAIFIFIAGGALVEYWWPAIALGVFVWMFYKKQSLVAVLLAILSCALLSTINGNHWALAALPLIMLLGKFDISFPRLRWAFYFYYPLHLTAFLLIRIPLKKAGYLFF